MIESTLCLIKPDAVRRALAGELLARFERAGLRIAALKLLVPDRRLAEAHYTWEDIGLRHGAKVRDALLDFITGHPVIAFVASGDSAVATVRKLVGSTEPLQALPGTIRGDYAHQSFALAGQCGVAIRNLIHASASPEDARREIPLWFAPEEIIDWRRWDQADLSLE
jgi:nucleoside-diphosphate kinase